MTTPPEPQPDAALGQRVTALETGQSSILEKLDQLLGAGAPPEEPAEPERPEVDIAAEIRRQLSARDKAKPKDPPKAPAAAELAEQPPKAPVRKLTKFMWGGDE